MEDERRQRLEALEALLDLDVLSEVLTDFMMRFTSRAERTSWLLKNAHFKQSYYLNDIVDLSKPDLGYDCENHEELREAVVELNEAGEVWKLQHIQFLDYSSLLWNCTEEWILEYVHLEEDMERYKLAFNTAVEIYCNLETLTEKLKKCNARVYDVVTSINDQYERLIIKEKEALAKAPRTNLRSARTLLERIKSYTKRLEEARYQFEEIHIMWTYIASVWVRSFNKRLGLHTHMNWKTAIEELLEVDCVAINTAHCRLVDLLSQLHAVYEALLETFINTTNILYM